MCTLAPPPPSVCCMRLCLCMCTDADMHACDPMPCGAPCHRWRAFKDMQPAWSEVNEIIDYWAADNATTHPRTYAGEWEDWLSVSRPGVFQDPDALLVGNARTAPTCRGCVAHNDTCKPSRDAKGVRSSSRGCGGGGSAAAHVGSLVACVVPSYPTVRADEYACYDDRRTQCLCCGSLSAVEEQTNMAMWAMWAAPLEMAADLRSISAASAKILQNPEVIAVNRAYIPSLHCPLPDTEFSESLLWCWAAGHAEDPLVYQARRVSNNDGLQVWQKRLVDGSVAVALYNAGESAVPRIPLIFETVGFSSVDRVMVRDLIGHQNLGTHVGELSINSSEGLTAADAVKSSSGAPAAPRPLLPPIEPHGVTLLKLSIAW
jgi:hypothetical protein